MLLALVATLLAAPAELPTRVDEVRVAGLWWSRELNVRRELTFREGDVVTADQWELLTRRLWNLGVFSRVKLELLDEPGKRVGLVTVEDRFPITPIVRFNFGGGQFFTWLGLADVNLFGRALEGRGLYERFGDQNGFHLSLTDPRFLDRRVSLMVQGEWLSRPQPTFTVRRAAVRSAVDFNFPGTSDDRFRLGAQLEGAIDQLSAVADSPEAPPVSSNAVMVGVFTRLGRLDTERLRLRAGFVAARGDLIISTDPSHPIAGAVSTEGQYFWMLGERVNIGGRVLAAIERNARPQDRFYIGGLDKVRGYAYSEFRAQAYATVNAELRVVAFDSTWFALMPIAFIDGGLALQDTGQLQPLASAGVGLRAMVPRLARLGVRFEVAFPFAAGLLTPALKPGINFGIWHYF